ncbi:hypothetical protein DAPPUDRAFT_18276, partial [Daphnia pulex]
LPTYLPSVAALKEAVKKARDWNLRREVLKNPHLEALESLMSKPIAIRLDSLAKLENQITAAQTWRKRTAKTLLRNNSYYSLID